MMFDQWVIWGAGVFGRRLYQFLDSSGEKVALFADNDIKLHGRMLGNVEIESIEKAVLNKEYNVCICISGKYKELREELIKRYHVKPESIYSFVSCIMQVLDKKKYLFIKCNIKKNSSNKKNILFGCSYGLKLGGIETWVLTWGELLKKYEYKIKYLMRSCDGDIFRSDCILVESENFKESWNCESIYKIVEIISENLPCVFVANYPDSLIFAAYVAKCLFPGQVQIISVVHGGKKELLEWNWQLEPFIDRIIGVAQNGICNKLNGYKLNPKKISHIVSPVSYPDYLERDYFKEGRLNIGYAARLTLEDKDKRTDYLIPLIKLLEKSDLNYCFQIAGEGEYKKVLEDYVNKNHLEKRIIIKGLIEREKMVDFWKTQDVFINVSDSEGNCMSMMEAMAQGVVPILTDVSGVRDIVENTKNGFIVNCGDINSIKEYIKYMYYHIELLPIMGNKAYNAIVSEYNIHRMTRKFIQCIEGNLD